MTDYLSRWDHSAALRWTIISIAALGALYLLGVLFQTWRPARTAVRITFSYLLLALLPYVFILHRLLADARDPGGLGMAAIVATLTTALIGLNVVLLVAFNPFVAMAEWRKYLAVAVFTATQVALVRTSVAQLIADENVGRGLGAGLVSAALCAGLLAVLAVPLGRRSDQLGRRTSYSTTAAQAHLRNAFTILWRRAGPGAVNGFPRTEAEFMAMGPGCWDPAMAPDGSAYGTFYDVRYTPAPPDPDGRVRGFTIATRQRSPRRGFADSYALDHGGMLRHSPSGKDWAGPGDPVVYEASTMVGTFLGMCDAFKGLRGCYPRHLALRRDKDTGADTMPLSHHSGTAPSKVDLRPDGSTVVHLSGGNNRSFVYTPDLTHGAAPRSCYRMSYRAGRRDIADLRSYLVDEPGQVHVTAEDRDATVDDPVAANDKLDRIRAESRQWAVEFLQQA